MKDVSKILFWLSTSNYLSRLKWFAA